MRDEEYIRTKLEESIAARKAKRRNRKDASPERIRPSGGANKDLLDRLHAAYTCIDHCPTDMQVCAVSAQFLCEVKGLLRDAANVIAETEAERGGHKA